MPENLVLVLATQRVGSTFFERGLQNMGGLGRPWEYFPHYLQAMQDEPKPEVRRGLVEACLTSGRTADGTVGITIMANYFSVVAKAYLGVPQAKRCEDVALWISFWEAFRPRFDRVIAFHLTRDVVDQAVSQLFSEQTGVNHVFQASQTTSMEHANDDTFTKHVQLPPARMSHHAAVSSVTPERLLKRIQRLTEERRKLTAFDAAAGLGALQVDYALSTGAPEVMARRIFDHAGGVAASTDFASDTKKVLPDALADGVKAQLADYLDVSAEDRAAPGALALAASDAAQANVARQVARQMRYKVQRLRSWARG